MCGFAPLSAAVGSVESGAAQHGKPAKCHGKPLWVSVVRHFRVPVRAGFVDYGRRMASGPRNPV
nr:hypothetical protein [Kibdelosporangium sp. MJ126-NF4]CTQ94383.1 hypothetical protein [Kibdelosporangium sp. MJ126-NF4]